MTLAPPGGRGGDLKVRKIVKPTISNVLYMTTYTVYVNTLT